MLLGATLIARSQAGSRKIDAAAFFTNAMVTSMRDDEMVEAVEFPAPAPGTGFAFCELARRSGDFALVSVAATIRRDKRGEVTGGAVALGGVGDVPWHFSLGEFAPGAHVNAKTFEAFGQHVAGAIEARSDLHASAEYRRSIAAVLVQRALDAATARTSFPS
jgi:aerobic carbon-monoxide dehydrogenase medium subunit